MSVSNDDPEDKARMSGISLIHLCQDIVIELEGNVRWLEVRQVSMIRVATCKKDKGELDHRGKADARSP